MLFQVKIVTNSLYEKFFTPLIFFDKFTVKKIFSLNFFVTNSI